jgi:hypothetical protein
MRLTSTGRLGGLGFLAPVVVLAAIACTPGASGQAPPAPREPPRAGEPEAGARPPRRPPPPGVAEGQRGPHGPRAHAPLDEAGRAELVRHLRELADRIEAGEDVPLPPLPPPPARDGRPPFGPGPDAGRRPPLPPRAAHPPRDGFPPPPRVPGDAPPRAPDPGDTREAPAPRQVPVSAP